MLTKRKLFGTLAALAVAVPAGITAVTTYTAQAATVPATIPMNFTNNTGRSDPVYLYVLGTNLTTGKLGYANAAGQFTAWNPGANPPVAAPDVAISGPATGGSVTIQLPKLSGRIYFSFGQKLKFFLTPDGLVQPAVQNPSDPNRDTSSTGASSPQRRRPVAEQLPGRHVRHSTHRRRHRLRRYGKNQTGKIVDGGRKKVFDVIFSPRVTVGRT